MQKDYILSVLKETMYEHMPDPGNGIKDTYFETLSYRKWAIDEAIAYVYKSDLDVSSALCELGTKAFKYSSFNKKSSIIFKEVWDVTIEMREILRAME